MFILKQNRSKPIRFSNSIIKINRSAPEHEPLLSQVKSAYIRKYYFWIQVLKQAGGMLRGGHFSGGHRTPSNLQLSGQRVGVGVDADPASGNCKLDGLPAALEGRWSGDGGGGNLLQCNFSQPRREKKTIAGTGRPGTGGKLNTSRYSIYCT